MTQELFLSLNQPQPQPENALLATEKLVSIVRIDIPQLERSGQLSDVWGWMLNRDPETKRNTVKYIHQCVFAMPPS